MSIDETDFSTSKRGDHISGRIYHSNSMVMCITDEEDATRVKAELMRPVELCSQSVAILESRMRVASISHYSSIGCDFANAVTALRDIETTIAGKCQEEWLYEASGLQVTITMSKRSRTSEGRDRTRFRGMKVRVFEFGAGTSDCGRRPRVARVFEAVLVRGGGCGGGVGRLRRTTRMGRMTARIAARSVDLRGRGTAGHARRFRTTKGDDSGDSNQRGEGCCR